MKFTFPTTQVWEKLLNNWSDTPNCGEKKLIVAVIANAIYDQRKDMQPIVDKERFWGEMFSRYCALIDLSADYVRKQILVASTRHGDEVKI